MAKKSITKQVAINLDFQKQCEQQPFWLTNMLTKKNSAHMIKLQLVLYHYSWV